MAQEDVLEKEIQKMKKSSENFTRFVKEQREKNKKTSQISLILTIVIVVVFVLFVWAIYGTISANLTSEKFLASFKKHGPDVLPPVTEKIAEVVTDVYPVYYELGVQKTVEALPEWSMIVEKELVKFSEETQEKATNQLKLALMGAIKKQNAPLRQAFTKLTDEDANVLIEGLQTDLASDMTDIMVHIEQRTFGQLLNLKKTLDGFDTGGLPDDEGQLSKLFIHNMLLLLDKEVMEGGTKLEKGRKWDKRKGHK